MLILLLRVRQENRGGSPDFGRDLAAQANHTEIYFY